MNRRMLPPADNSPQSRRTVNGRTYTGTAGVPVTVAQGDAQMLEANGWTFVGYSCASADRPRPNDVNSRPRATRGLFVFDETLNQMIVFADTWRDPVTGAAV